MAALPACRSSSTATAITKRSLAGPAMRSLCCARPAPRSNSSNPAAAAWPDRSGSKRKSSRCQRKSLPRTCCPRLRMPRRARSSSPMASVAASRSTSSDTNTRSILLRRWRGAGVPANECSRLANDFQFFRCVAGYVLIARDQGQVLRPGLCDKDSIEWILVVKWKGKHLRNVLRTQNAGVLPQAA